MEIFCLTIPHVLVIITIVYCDHYFPGSLWSVVHKGSLLIPKTTIKRLTFFKVSHLPAFLRPSYPSQINDQGFVRFCNLSLIAHLCLFLGFPGGTSSKEFTFWYRSHKRCMFHSWVRKISWRRKWQPTPVFLRGKSHGRWNLVGYSPWSPKELDTTERLHFHFKPLVKRYPIFSIMDLEKIP